MTAPGVTGERVVTSEGGFNPTWQRHVAAYRDCAGFLPQGTIADIGCGIGHSYRLLAPRTTVGVDLDPAALEDQDRQTVVADMRELPFPRAQFDGAISVHSIEHVPDPERALAEMVRVVRPGGVVTLVTPNRLTFARPEEIIDPYHYVEYDPHQLRSLCARFFEEFELAGLFGSDRYLALVAREHEKLDALLRRDRLGLRRIVPRRVLQRLYDHRLGKERAEADPGAAQIDVEDFTLGRENLPQALDLLAVCRLPAET